MACESRSLIILPLVLCILQFAVVLAAGAQEADSLIYLEEAAQRAAADRVAESVVHIRTIGGIDSPDVALLASGPTTGVVVSSDGFIISSAFNFMQQPASIVVTFATGKQLPAELVATDHSRMLVLLKVSGTADLAVPELAPADDTRPGQWAIAVGRAFRPDRVNLSVGIVSAVDRMFGKVIQTDADVSTANYGGPLVDIRGRVLGIVVPMAPQGASEVAGTEWYDSGIGFAVPLASISDRLDLMKQGEDQHPGILGIGMLQKNPHSSPAELAAVRPDSPAGRVGFKKGDRILEMDGKPIRNQTDLRFALGPRYAGEKVSIVAKRGDEKLERTIELVAELPAFRHAYLGILPMRPATLTETNASEPDAEESGEAQEEAEAKGILVRMVCDGSPAAEAGITAGDRILRINETDITSIDDALGALNNVAPGNEITLRRESDGKQSDIKLTAARTSTSVPNDLPPAIAGTDGLPTTLKGETSELRLPEFPHECHVYVPASHATGRPQAALLWLCGPNADADAVIDDWRSICDRDGILLIAPTTTENGRWEMTDGEYLQKLIERVIAQYKIDRHRIVVYGEDGGGALAWILGLSRRDLFRGVGTLAAPLPRQIRVPQNEPTQRLAVFAAVPPGNNAAALQIAEGLQKVSDAGYTITSVDATGTSRGLSSAQRDELARWIDALDRF